MNGIQKLKLSTRKKSDRGDTAPASLVNSPKASNRQSIVSMKGSSGRILIVAPT